MTMRIDEVMMGDIVSVSGNPIHVTLAVLNHWSDNIEPIPLTPEILEKNGLDNDPLGCFFDEDKYREFEISSIYGDIYWSINYNEYGILQLEYVHQLQHALRLCGINKEIVV